MPGLFLKVREILVFFNEQVSKDLTKPIIPLLPAINFNDINTYKYISDVLSGHHGDQLITYDYVPV